jgi:hypothetical protein
MQLSMALRDPLGAARGLRRRVGRTVRRLQDRARYALPSENGLLRDLGGRFGTLDEALRDAARDSGRLFVVDLPRPEAAAFFAEHPGRRARILERAGAARAHRFDLLGSGPVDLGPRIPWHADFVAGHAWDRGAYFRDLAGRIQAEFGAGRDVKIPWELSRFQHAPCLGQALWLTGDRGFYETFRDQVRDWIRGNRAPFGVNWTCTMDVAIRAVNWVWGYAFFRPEILADRPFASLLLRALFTHGRFIADNLENGGPVTSNHYLADLLGLLFLGVLLRGSPEADVWKGTAIAEIVRESERQTLPDGVDCEASTAYHRLKTEMLLTALLLMERSGFSFPALRARVRAMIDYVAHYTKPDGLAPQIGDNDDGRLQILGDYDADRRDHRHLLAVAGAAFEDPALAALAGPRLEEALWLCGPGRLRRVLAAPRPRPALAGRLFPHGGTAILREADLYAVMDAGPVGLGGHGAHAHNDTLAVEIQAGGRDLIVDPGTGGYTRDLRVRQRFRATAAHNTVRVDGEEINPLPDRPFELPGTDRPAVLRFVSRRGFDLVEAEHGGYLRLADPVRHRRLLLLNKRTRRFVLEDHLEGRGRHRLEFFFHLAPGGEAFVEEDAVVACRAGGVRFRIRPTLAPAGLRVRRDEDLFSPGYGRIVPALTVRFEWDGDLPVVARFAIEVEA